MFEKIQLWVDIISTAVMIITVYAFFDMRFHPRFHKHLNISLCAAFSVLSAIAYVKIEDEIYKTLFLYLCFVLTGLLFNMRWFNRAIYPALFFAITIAVEFVVELMIRIFIFHGEYEVSPSNEIIYDSVYREKLCYVFKTVLTRLLELMVILVLRIKVQRVLSEYQPRLMTLLITVPAFSVGIILSLHSVLQSYEVKTPSLFYAIVCAAFIAALNLMVFYYIDVLQENNVSTHAMYAANKLIEHRTEQYEELLSNQEKVLKLHHDYKKFFTGLVASFDEKNTEKTKAELIRQYEELNQISAPVQSGNILQTILNAKEKMMNRYYIVANLEYKELYRSRISQIDTAIIFGNALDNAIEACMKFPTEDKKVIDIYGEVKNNIVVYVIKNPVVRNIDVKNMKTTKNAFGHGYGILSMQNLAKKHGGDVSFECKDRVFTTYIMMRNEP